MKKPDIDFKNIGHYERTQPQKAQRYNLAPVVAAAPKVVAIIGKIKPIAQIVSKVKDAVGKILPGGVTQDRFFERYDQIKSIFKNAGYPVAGARHDELLTKFRIRKTQVTDKKTNGTYEDEFQRLRQWVVQVLNDSNPGLGDLYGELFPEFPMANKGNMIGEPIEALKEIVGIEPGTFTPQMKNELLSARSAEQLVQQVAKTNSGVSTPTVTAASSMNEVMPGIKPLPEVKTANMTWIAVVIALSIIVAVFYGGGVKK